MIKDHLGNEFKNKRAMLNYYGVPERSYYAKVKRGVSLEDILTVKDKMGVVQVDHLGNRYPSLRVMCETYGIDSRLYLNRVQRLGWSVERALTETVGITEEHRTDHLGNVYPTFRAMCNAYGKEPPIVLKRMNVHGFTKEAALTVPVGKTGRGYDGMVARVHSKPKRVWKDHLGQEFEYKEDLAAHWGINVNLYNSRLRQGWSLEDVLTKPVIRRNKRK